MFLYICSFSQLCYKYLLNTHEAPSTVTGFGGRKHYKSHAFLSICSSEGQQINKTDESDIVYYMVISMVKTKKGRGTRVTAKIFTSVS